MVVKHFLVSDRTDLEMHEMNVYFLEITISANSFEHISKSLTIFIHVLYSMRMLYDTSES
jgi:hypothetical protein